MERHFDQELKDLKQDILKIGAFAEEAIYKSVEALKNRDKELAKSVIDNDNNVDQLELAIDEKCIDLIARYQPYSNKFMGDHSTINAKRGLDHLFTYAPPEISAESPHEEPIEVCQEHQEHYEEHKKQIILPPHSY